MISLQSSVGIKGTLYCRWQTLQNHVCYVPFIPAEVEMAKKHKSIYDHPCMANASHHPFLPHSRAALVMKTTGDESALLRQITAVYMKRIWHFFGQRTTRKCPDVLPCDWKRRVAICCCCCQRKTVYFSVFRVCIIYFLVPHITVNFPDYWDCIDAKRNVFNRLISNVFLSAVSDDGSHS